MRIDDRFDTRLAPCPQFNENNFEFPGFYIFLGVTVLSTIRVYVLQRRKEEREHIQKILKKNQS